MLVVSEKYAEKFMWKLPGGYVKPGEEISTAAVREVLEETNIKTEFVSVVCFRQMFPGIFGRYGVKLKISYRMSDFQDRSDLYFIVLLKPLSHEIKIEEAEIAAAKWMPLAEYAYHSDVVPTNRFIAGCVKKMLDDPAQMRLLPHHIPSTWNLTFATLYALGEQRHHESK